MNQSTWAESWLATVLTDGTSAILFFASIAIVLALLVLGVWWLRRRWRLRRIAARVGLDALEPHERLRLARQLAFYDDLLRALDRRRLVRQPSQTPLEFARGLVTLPSGAYETVHRLTQIFYRVRYGRKTLSPAALERLETVVGRFDREAPLTA